MALLWFLSSSVPLPPNLPPAKKHDFLKHSAQKFISHNKAHGQKQTTQEKCLYISSSEGAASEKGAGAKGEELLSPHRGHRASLVLEVSVAP